MHFRYPTWWEASVVGVEDEPAELFDGLIILAPARSAAFVCAAFWYFPFLGGVNTLCSCSEFSAVSLSKKRGEFVSSSFSTWVQNQFETLRFSLFAAAVTLCLSGSESDMLNDTCPSARSWFLLFINKS
jgi:hypothetical protein